MLFVGYQAAGTRGRQLLEGAETVKIHGQLVPRGRAHRAHRLDVGARGRRRDHALAARLHARRPAMTYLVHGEPPAQDALKARIEQELGWHRPRAGLPGAGAAVSGRDDRPYLLERVDDAAVVQLYADGFDELAPREKTLVYHLSRAALAGRDIYYDQRYAPSLDMREVLEAILTHAGRRRRPTRWRGCTTTRSSSG